MHDCRLNVLSTASSIDKLLLVTAVAWNRQQHDRRSSPQTGTACLWRVSSVASTQGRTTQGKTHCAERTMKGGEKRYTKEEANEEEEDPKDRRGREWEDSLAPSAFTRTSNHARVAKCNAKCVCSVCDECLFCSELSCAECFADCQICLGCLRRCKLLSAEEESVQD